MTHEEALAQVTVHRVGDPEPLLAALADHEVTRRRRCLATRARRGRDDHLRRRAAVAGMRSALDEVAG